MYVGRFAPSPTGPLHFGSLIAAVASYCDAKKNQGQWLVRMEDLDQTRTVNGAADTILHQLQRFGFEWDGSILYQSQRTAAYEAALKGLSAKSLIYACTCTRKEIADSSLTRGIEGAIYPGNCLRQPIKPYAPTAWRIKTGGVLISFQDAIQGYISQNISSDIGDFILKRADGLFAYQLAVVVDDAAQGITHVVRGADLLDSTPRQIYLQKQLGLAQPCYAHIPVVCNAAGEKLSKQTLAAPLDASKISLQLVQAMDFLGQTPPAQLAQEHPHILWQWALSNWQLSKVPPQKTMHYTHS